MAKRVWSHPLGDARFTGDALHDPRRRVSIETRVVGTEEAWAFAAFADREVDRSGGARREWDDHGLAALAQDGQGAVSSFETERFDVCSGRFQDPQPVEREQADQG